MFFFECYVRKYSKDIRFIAKKIKVPFLLQMHYVINIFRMFFFNKKNTFFLDFLPFSKIKLFNLSCVCCNSN